MVFEILDTQIELGLLLPHKCIKKLNLNCISTVHLLHDLFLVLLLERFCMNLFLHTEILHIVELNS